MIENDCKPPHLYRCGFSYYWLRQQIIPFIPVFTDRAFWCGGKLSFCPELDSGLKLHLQEVGYGKEKVKGVSKG
ncbi:MAG: hypothetical protein AB1478_06715 [Nitrospirota bacterium]